MINALIIACICSGLFSFLVTSPIISQNKADGVDVLWPYTTPIIIFLTVFVIAQYFFSDNFIREFKKNLRENKKKREEKISKAIDEKYGQYFNSLPDFKAQYKTYSINLPIPTRDSCDHVSTLVRFIILYTWTMGIAGYMILAPDADIYNYIFAIIIIILNIGFVIVTIACISSTIDAVFIEGVNKDHILMGKYYKEMSEAVIEEELDRRKKSESST